MKTCSKCGYEVVLDGYSDNGYWSNGKRALRRLYVCTFCGNKSNGYDWKEYHCVFMEREDFSKLKVDYYTWDFENTYAFMAMAVLFNIFFPIFFRDLPDNALFILQIIVNIISIVTVMENFCRDRIYRVNDVKEVKPVKLLKVVPKIHMPRIVKWAFYLGLLNLFYRFISHIDQIVLFVIKSFKLGL